MYDPSELRDQCAIAGMGITDNLQPLAGRVAIVTGGSRGIGKGIAERIASAGATVIIGARSVSSAGKQPGTVDEAVALIESRGGKAYALQVDMENAASRKKFIQDAIAKVGHVDILVNNAGTAIYKPTDEMTLEEATAQVTTYFLGPWDLCHQILPHMKARGRGWILNLGSCSFFPHEQPPYDEFNATRGNETMYSALKTAMHRFSKGLAAEVHKYNISVNVLAPVMGIFTPGLASLSIGMDPNLQIDAKTANMVSRPFKNKAKAAMVPMCEPIEHIAEAAVELLSHEPRDYTGKVAFSFEYLDEIGHSTRTLDNKAVFHERKHAKG